MLFPLRSRIHLALICAFFLSGAPADAAEKIPAEAMRLLQRNCISCHNPEKKKGGVDLSTRESALKGGDEGPVLASKKPEKSKLISVLAADADPHMPPKKQLKPAEIELLRKWVAAGAQWDQAALAAASKPREVKIASIPENLNAVYAVAVSPDGKRLAIGRRTKIQVLDLASTNSAPVKEWTAHSEFVRALAWGPDDRLASGSFREVAIWSDGKELSRTQARDRVNAIQFSNGDLIVADGAEVSIHSKTNWLAHDQWINAIAVSSDGKLIATAAADRLIKIWDRETRKEITRLEGHSQAVYGLAFNTNATELITVGADKFIFVWDVKTRESFVTLPDRKNSPTSVVWPAGGKHALVVDEGGDIWAFNDFKRHSGAQSSDAANERRLAAWESPLHSLSASEDGKVISVGHEDGVVRVLDETGKVKLKLEAAPKIQIAATEPSFVRDVLPVMAKLGCMGGSCHAKPAGQNGFKLSVFSYDPKADFFEITGEARGRRVFPAAPEESLILLKPTAQVEHGGGERMAVGSESYQLIARWIRAGMPYQHTNEANLVSIEATPADATYKKKTSVPLRVIAKFADGTSRDVTRLSEYSANDKEIAQVTDEGVIRAGTLSGETVIVARYMGHVAASHVTIPADRKLAPEKYATLPANNFIDTLAHQNFERLGLFPSELCADSEFQRRSTLDAIGRLPSMEETRAFLSDNFPAKRERWIAKLLDDPAYADYWANRWADLLRPNPDRVGVKSIFTLDQWLREAFRANMPFDEFARAILTAEGSNHRDGPAVVYRDRREPSERTTMFSQLFLGTRMECAKCHHHPNEKWSQDDFYQFAAFFADVKQKGAGLSPPISAGTESFFFDAGSGVVKHPVTGEKMEPRPPDGPLMKSEGKKDPREDLVSWLTDPKNPFFAKAAVNRVWAVFFGRGFVDPVDDFRASNPVVQEALLNALAEDFSRNGYNLKKLMRTIMTSRLYQLSSTPNETNLADTKNFSRSYRRRLPAEVLLDAVNDVTWAADEFNGCPPGTRAIQTWSYKISSHFLDAFSRPNSSTDAPCERDMKISVVQSLHLMNSKNLQEKISRAGGRIKTLADSKLSEEEIIGELYLAALTRGPTVDELQIAKSAFAQKGATRQTATEDILWALLNSPEFVFNH